MEDVIKESLINFICEECRMDKSVIVGTLDDPILNYVTTSLADTLHTPPNPSTPSLDISEFTETLTAYFPSFSQIPANKITLFINKLTVLLKKESPKRDKSLDTAWIDVASQVGSGSRASVSELDLETLSIEEGSGRKMKESSRHLGTLAEMFPNYSKADLGMVLSLVNDDLERGVQILLLDDEEGEGIVKGLAKGGDRKKGSEGCEDKKGLKERLVERYGFIDKSEDGRDHRPTLPNPPPPKLLRYREGQVVSTKGERFTEVAVTSTGEEVKIRSYLSKSQRLAMAEGRSNN